MSLSVREAGFLFFVSVTAACEEETKDSKEKKIKERTHRDSSIRSLPSISHVEGGSVIFFICLRCSVNGALGLHTGVFLHSSSWWVTCSYQVPGSNKDWCARVAHVIVAKKRSNTRRSFSACGCRVTLCATNTHILHVPPRCISRNFSQPVCSPVKNSRANQCAHIEQSAPSTVPEKKRGGRMNLLCGMQQRAVRERAREALYELRFD